MLSTPIPASITHAQFSGWVQDALNHLYDSAYLQAHPLAALYFDGENNAVRRSQQVRRLLIDALHSVRPENGTPAQSPDWRACQILELRYVEGLSPHEVMDQVGLGKSQYYREQARALELVTNLLWTRLQAMLPQESAQTQETAQDLSDLSRDEMARLEAERICAQAEWDEVDASELLSALYEVVYQLAAAKGVHANLQPLDHLLVTHADRVLLRQALLNLISFGLDMARGGTLSIEQFAGTHEKGFRVVAIPAARAAASSPESSKQRRGIGLEICRHLVEVMGGRLDIRSNAQGEWQASLAWRTSGTKTFLVVDDNRAFVELVRRYLTGDDWYVIGAASGQEARRLLQEIRPTVILLDVMMPHEDGWELLRAFKNDAKTREIPIIVCSVLNEPELAAMLGAAAYLVKPVSRDALLELLNGWRHAVPTLVPGR